MAFHAQSWGRLRVEGQPRGCGHSPSLWCKVPGEHRPKLPQSVCTAGRSKLFRNLEQCWESSERGGSCWPLLLSCLFPHICEVSEKVIKDRLGLFLLGWHISMPHQHWPGTTDLVCPKVSRLPSNARRHKLLLYVISFFYAIS